MPCSIPELLATFEKLGIPLDEQKRLANVAVDAVFDSVSIYTSHKKKLMEMGIIFCSISDAIKEYPELIEEYLGSVVPAGDNYFAALNSAVFGDGSFVYIPPGVKCPMDLSTYFRINNKEAGQFERTLIIADDDASVSYLEGCTAPEFSSKQLHSAIVELVAKENASIKYSTVQNWYAGDRETGAGGVYNFVTKRGKCAGKNSRISWTQVETGSAITWKYPSCILQGDNSVGEFYSVALTNGHMQADTGTKMIHIGKNTKSTIISKGISADYSSNAYRGEVSIRAPRALPTHSPTSPSRTQAPRPSTKQRPAVSAKTSCSTSKAAASSAKTLYKRWWADSARTFSRNSRANLPPKHASSSPSSSSTASVNTPNTQLWTFNSKRKGPEILVSDPYWCIWSTLYIAFFTI